MPGWCVVGLFTQPTSGGGPFITITGVNSSFLKTKPILISYHTNKSTYYCKLLNKLPFACEVILAIVYCNFIAFYIFFYINCLKKS